MYNKAAMTSSIDHQESSFIKHRARLNSSSNDDPWCLFCRTNLKTEHLPYKYIFDKLQPLDGLIESRLGLELDTTLPSAYLCHKCERELQRMSWRDAAARRDVQFKLESNLHLWPPQSSLPAPGERVTVSTNAASDHQRLFNKDAASSSSFQNLQPGAGSDSVTMASTGFREAKEVQFQAGEIGDEHYDNEEDEGEEGEEEEEEEEEETFGDTTTYIFYCTPSGTVETKLVSHEKMWNPSRKRKVNKTRTSSRHSSGDSEKHSRSESTSFSQDPTFEDVLSSSVPDRLNKTDRLGSRTSSSYNASRDLTVLEPQSLEMNIPEGGETRSSTATTTRLRHEHHHHHEEERGVAVDEGDDSLEESEEDTITTTTTTTTTTTMTTPKGTTQWTKTRIKTIWDDVAEEEETEEVAVEVATPTTPLPSSTEAAVAAASAATKKAFSHSPDTRRRRREHRQSSKERNDEDEYRGSHGVEKKAKTDRFEEGFVQEDDSCRSPSFDMDTTTTTTQYYDQSRMDSGRPKSLQLAGDNLGNVCLYRGNYGDVGRDSGERDGAMDKVASTGLDMKYISPEDDQEQQYLHGKPVSSAVEWLERKDGRLEYYNKNIDKRPHSEIEAEDYYMINKEEEEEQEQEQEGEEEEEGNVVNYREKKEESEREEEEKTVNKVEKRESYPSQFCPQQDIDVCQEFPLLSRDQQTGNYRSGDVGAEGNVRVDGSYRLDENGKETIINSSLGYQSTEFNSGYPPDSYPDEQSEIVKEHWSSSSTTDRYVEVDRGQMPKAGVTATYDRRTDNGVLTNSRDSYPKDRDQTRSGLERDTEFTDDQEEDDSNEEMYSAGEGSQASSDGTGSSKNQGGGQKEGGGGGGGEASGVGSPSQLRRQGSKESRSSGRHRKRRHKGRKRDRSKDSVNSNDSSGGSSNPVMQPHEEAGGGEEVESEELSRCKKGQVSPTSVEEGDGATAIAACSEQMEEEEVEDVGKGGNVLPTDEWHEQIEQSKAGATTSGHLWTTAAGDTTTGGEERGGSTASPGIDHSPTTELAYKCYPGDYSQRYYDDGGGGGDGGGGSDGQSSNNDNNDKFEREEKKLDEDNNNNNNGVNNSNEEFCSVERETTRFDETCAVATSTQDAWEANPASGNPINPYQHRDDSEDKTADRHYDRRSDIEGSPSFPDNKSLADPSSPPLGGDYSSPQTVDKTQSDADYVSPTSYTLEENSYTIKLSSPTMNNQEDDIKTDSDTNATYTYNMENNNEPIVDTNLMDTHYELNNASTIGENSNNMDANQVEYSDNVDSNQVECSDNMDSNKIEHSNNMDANKVEYSYNMNDNQVEYSDNMDSKQAEFGGDLNVDATITAATSDAQWSEPNREHSNEIEYSYNMDANEVVCSDNMDTKVEFSDNMDDNLVECSDNINANEVEHADNMDTKKNEYSDNMDASEVGYSDNMAANQGEYSDNMDANPIEYPDNMDAKKNEYSDNMDANEVGYSDNMAANQGEYSDNMDANPIEYPDNMDAKKNEYSDNMDANEVGYSDNMAANQGEYSDNMDANPIEYSDSVDANQVEYSDNMDSKQAEFGGDLNVDATITAATSDAQWSEPNRAHSSNADLDETSAIRDDYESYHKEFGYTGEGLGSHGNECFTSNYNAYETSDQMYPSPSTENKVTEFEEATSTGGWAGYKDSGNGDEQTQSLNDEIAQADQTTNWNESFGKERDEDDDVPKVNVWSPVGSDSQKEERDIGHDENRNYNNDYDITFDNDNEERKQDVGNYDEDFDPTYKDDSVENPRFEEVEVGKDFSDSYNREYDMSESRHDDSVNDTYARQDGTDDTYPRYDDNTRIETDYVIEGGESQNYGYEVDNYGDDTNATYNIDESEYYATDYGVNRGNTVDYFDERQEDQLVEDSGELPERISDFKIEEVDHEEGGMEYNMEQSPVDRGTSYTQDDRADNYRPGGEEDVCFRVDNMADFNNQDGIRSQHEDENEAGIDRNTAEDIPWQTTPSVTADYSARRPIDLHLASTIYKENSLTVEQEVDYEKQTPVETTNVDYIVSSPRQEAQSSPYISPSERKGERQVDSPTEQNIYWMNETTTGETDQETLEQFQGDDINPINVTSVCYSAVIGQRGTEVEEEFLMVQADEAEEITIVPEIRPHIRNGQLPFDDSRYSSMYDQNLIASLDSGGPSSTGPAWNSFSGHYEAGVEIEGMLEARLETVEETVITPSIRGVNDSYIYGYGSMMSNAVESGVLLDTEGQLRPPPMGGSDEPGGSSFPGGPAEYNQTTSANDSGGFAATSVGDSFLDVAGDTEQKSWVCFESSENKGHSAFGVEPHIERLRYGVRVRSGRAAATAGRKKDDQKPLIGSEWRPLDGKEFDDRDGDSGFWTPDTENDDNQETETMPFGFGKKKKSAPVIEEKQGSPVAEAPQKVEIVEQVAVKIEEVVKPAKDAEDAGDNSSQQAVVPPKETTIVQEETKVEMVVSDAVDGGAEKLVDIEQKSEAQIEDQEKIVEHALQSAEETVKIEEEKEETTKPEVDTANEPEVIEKDVVVDDEKDLAVAQEVMSVDLKELEDDFEVVILDRFAMLGQPVVEQLPVESVAEKNVVESPVPVVEKQPNKQPRVESTPLIGKQTKVKDTQPGFLCCTII